MTQDQITAQYLKYRTQLHDELVTLEAQIPTLTSRRDKLKDLLYGELKTNFDVVPAKKVPTKRVSAKQATKKTTRRAVQKKTQAPVTVSAHEEQLLGFLKEHPGSSRDDIRNFLNGQLSEKDQSLLLSKLSRKKAIVNMGSKPASSWHLT